MRSHLLVGLGSALCVAALLLASCARASAAAGRLPPDRAVTLAVSAHPDVRRAQAALATAVASRTAAGPFLANPNVDAWVATDGSRSDLAVSQPLSLAGEGWHARRGFREQADAAGDTLSRRRRQVAADVRVAYARAAVATGVVRIAEEGTELASRLAFAVRRRHEEGEASTLELRLARLTEVQAAARLLAARRSEADALRALSALVLTPVSADQLDADPGAAAPAATAPLAGSARADVRAAEAAVRAARADLRRARAATVPAVSVGVGVEFEGGTPFLGPAVGLRLPLSDQNQAERARATGAVQIAEGRLAAARAVADTERATSAVRLSEAEAMTAAVADADVAQARAALASIESGLLAGQIDLSTAVLLQVQVLDGEAAVVRLQGLLAEARIDRLLALDDDALLGGGR